MVNSSISSELSRFFKVLDDSPVALINVTTAAFCKARKKLSYTAFKTLNSCLVDTFYHAQKVKRWKGFRLLAVDGSVTKLPPSEELFSFYGKARSFANNPAIRLSQLYDVLNHITVDLQAEKHSTGERSMAMKHLEQAGDKDLILYDRGYPAVWFYKYHMLKNVNFCMRIVHGSNVVKAFLESGEESDVVDFPCTEKSLRRCRKDKISTETISLRLVRVELPSGGIEVLVTSLIDKQVYPTSIFSDLYHQRWGVEEDYKIMKSRLTIENYSGFSVDAVLQDIYAKSLTKNITAVAVGEAEKLNEQTDKKRKHKYKINFTNALSELKDNAVRFMMNIAPDNLSERLIMGIARVTNAYRPERKCSREQKRHPYGYPVAYKPIC